MSLEQEVELIRRFPIFKKIDLAMLKLLCFSSERLTYRPGQVIFDSGDPGDAAYVIIEGHVEVTVVTPTGPRVLNTLGPNDIVGEIAIFAEVPRTATVTTTTQVETLRIAKEQFMDVIRQNPDAALELIRILASRLARTTAQLTQAAGRDA
jgi:CRP/FNR family transcriptional regulator, cyclic AMP receptor protein